MRVLVTWGSKRGGTAGIGRIVSEALEGHGFSVVAAPAGEVRAIDTFDAVILGGALYANRWPGEVRRFVHRHVAQLRKKPVWFFSSGPLDDSADRTVIPAPSQVAILSELVGAKAHVTFGGRLARDAKGFPADAMAKTSSGDWRNPDRIRAWAAELATELPHAMPGTPIDHPGRSVVRLLTYGTVGWALCALTMLGLWQMVGVTTALVLHAIAAPALFAALAWQYFRVRGARDPLPTAVAWTMTVALLDLVVVGAGQHNVVIVESFAGTWLPSTLIFLVTWTTGVIRATLPWPTKTADVRT